MNTVDTILGFLGGDLLRGVFSQSRPGSGEKAGTAGPRLSESGIKEETLPTPTYDPKTGVPIFTLNPNEPAYPPEPAAAPTAAPAQPQEKGDGLLHQVTMLLTNPGVAGLLGAFGTMSQYPRSKGIGPRIGAGAVGAMEAAGSMQRVNTEREKASMEAAYKQARLIHEQQKLMKPEAPFAKPGYPTAKDYTPESIGRWQKSVTEENPLGNMTLLQPREKPEAPFARPSLPTPKDFTAESIRAWEATRTPENPIGDQSVLVPRETQKPESFGQDREARARRLFGVGYGSLEPGQMAVVDESMRKERTEQAVSERIAAAAATKDLIPGSAGNLMNPDTLDFAPGGLSAAAAREQGFTKRVTEKQKAGLAALQSVDTSLAEVKMAVENLKGRSALRLSAQRIPGSQMVSADARAGAAYESVRTRFAMIFDRLIGGVRAASSLPFTKFTSDRLLPGFFDDENVIDFKIQALETIVEAMKDEKRREVTGQPPNKAILDQLNRLGDTLASLDKEPKRQAPSTGRGAASQPGQAMTLEEYKRGKGQ